MDEVSITDHEFDLNRRGYDPDAVDAHLKEIAATVAAKDNEIGELRRAIADLESKVKDADESEEALRLTLKAAAHAKEELLAGARDTASTLERDATEKAQKLIADAEANASTITQDAETRARAMTEGASSQAREVARAALSESELLVVRVEQLRAQVQGAEDALRALSSEGSPRLEEARQALDTALEAARATAEDPDLLAAAAAPPPSPPIPERIEEATAEPADNDPGPDPTPQVPEIPQPEIPQPEIPQPEIPQPEIAEAADTEVPSAESSPDAPAASAEEAQEGVAESTADISDKVDRLLEELREVT